jgi:hypothetical protein
MLFFELSQQDLLSTTDHTFVGILTTLQEIEETQQSELRTWRDKAQKARIARKRALAKLQALSASRQSITIDASFGATKATLASSIDQVTLLSHRYLALASLLTLLCISSPPQPLWNPL